MIKGVIGLHNWKSSERQCEQWLEKVRLRVRPLSVIPDYCLLAVGTWANYSASRGLSPNQKFVDLFLHL